MRLALKNTLVLLAVYLVLAGAIGWWTVRELDEQSHAMVVRTARLVGDEVGRALTDSALDQLRTDDPAARFRLAEIVDQVTEHSSILTSVAVVDRAGVVIAGDNVAIGQTLALPSLVFPAAARARIVRAGGPFEQDTFYVMVPLLEGDALAGYVRLGMRTARIAELYARTRRNFLVAAIIGLAAVGVVGVMLHLQLLRRGAAVARALEDAARGVAPPPRRDEFAGAIEVAQRVGRELSEARGGRVQAMQRLDALMRALDVGVLIVEPDAALGFANAHAAALLGYTDPGALAADWEAIRPRLRAILAARDERGAARLEHELPADGRAADLRLELYPMGEGAAAPQLVLVRNASSLDALQAELGLAIQMRGLTRFYAAFAHDLKAPLNAMVLTLELLRSSLERPSAGGDLDAEKRQRYLTTLKDEIARLDRQLRALLAHTAPPRDERGDVDLCALLDLLVQLLSPQAKRQGVQMTCALPAAPVALVGHGDRLKQALLNILINALEAMPDGGELTIALEPAAGAARISVRDTGPGIPPELLDRIYQMHFTSKTGGTGVGLYVARSVVQSHGGMIDVQGGATGGTVFTVTLPTGRAGEDDRTAPNA